MIFTAKWIYTRSQTVITTLCTCCLHNDIYLNYTKQPLATNYKILISDRLRTHTRLAEHT